MLLGRLMQSILLFDWVKLILVSQVAVKHIINKITSGVHFLVSTIYKMSSQCFLYGEYNMHVQTKYKASHQGKGGGGGGGGASE